MVQKQYKSTKRNRWYNVPDPDYEKKYRDKNRDRINRVSREWRKKTGYIPQAADRNSNILEQLINNTPCRCSENDPVVKEFHHVDPNDRSMHLSGGNAHHSSVRKLIEELEKCEMLCANCHVREHKLQGGYRYAKICREKERV